MLTQSDQILRHLQKKPITALEALQYYGCFRLASRINDLRNAGHEIVTKKIKLKNGKTVAEYRLEAQSQ